MNKPPTSALLDKSRRLPEEIERAKARGRDDQAQASQRHLDEARRLLAQRGRG